MAEPKVTVTEEIKHNVKGTTSLHVFDAGFEQSGTTLEFHGNISSAPCGRLVIRKEHIVDNDDAYNLKYDIFHAIITQAHDDEKLDVYDKGRYFNDTIKKEYPDLNCETAGFEIFTKFNSDHFDTGADGMYGSLVQYKQYYGMRLDLYFDDDFYTMDEVEKRLLNLWPKRK